MFGVSHYGLRVPDKSSDKCLGLRDMGRLKFEDSVGEILAFLCMAFGGFSMAWSAIGIWGCSVSLVILWDF